MGLAGARFACVKGPLDQGNPSNRQRKLTHLAPQWIDAGDGLDTKRGPARATRTVANVDGGPMILGNGGKSVRQGPTPRTRKGSQRAMVRTRSCSRRGLRADRRS